MQPQFGKFCDFPLADKNLRRGATELRRRVAPRLAFARASAPVTDELDDRSLAIDCAYRGSTLSTGALVAYQAIQVHGSRGLGGEPALP